jgi:hypothetical protein
MQCSGAVAVPIVNIEDNLKDVPFGAKTIADCVAHTILRTLGTLHRSKNEGR